MLPTAVRQLVRAVADRLLAEALRVLQRAGGNRNEGGVAESKRPVGFGLLQFNRERLVVNDLEAGHGLHGGTFCTGLVVAGNAFKEAPAQLGILGSSPEVPGIDE
ncbi:hypothetical protein D9M72_513300 [compost metagenome]